MATRGRWLKVAACLAACAVIGTPVTAHADDGRRPTNGFSREGLWNTRLPAHVPLAANSAAIVHNILLDEQSTSGYWGVNTDTYSTPIYRVGPDTPRQRWTFSDCLNMPQLAP